MQVSRVSEALHLQVDSARTRITGTFSRSGSVLAGTAKSRMQGVEVELELQSPGERGQIAQLIRMAEETCYVRQTIKNPVESKLTVLLNGERLPGEGA